jgi:predicted RNA-binding protein YlqC (UPF0109 family)
MIEETNGVIRQPDGIEVFEGTGDDEDALRAKLYSDAKGRELFFIKMEPGEDGKFTMYGYPRTAVMDLIYEQAYPVIKILDDGAAIRVKSNRAVSDFFVIIQSRKSGTYIGRHGKTLDAVESLVAHTVSRRFPRWVSVTVDVDNYRRKQQMYLEQTVKRVMRDIERDHRERPIRGLLPKERKFVHSFLSGHPYLTTESRGDKKKRTLFIKPRDDIRE